MGWFTKEKCVVHLWRVTEALHITRHHDTPEYVVPLSKQTLVSRICKCCLKNETHTVNGHISMDEAKDIFEGVSSDAE